MGVHFGNRKANNRGESSLAAATDSWADVVVEGVPMFNGSWNFWPTITSAQSSRSTLNVEPLYEHPKSSNMPVTLPIVCTETTDEAIPIDTDSVLTNKLRRRATLASMKFSEALESTRISTGEPSRDPLMAADCKLGGALARTGRVSENTAARSSCS